MAGSLRILLDLGSGSSRSLARLGEPVESITAVGLTHRHMDHVGDLLPFLFALRYAPSLRRTLPVELFGYAGLRADLEMLSRIYGPWVLEPGCELRVRETPPGERVLLTAGGTSVEIVAHEVAHTPEAVAFRLQISEGDARRGGRTVAIAYTGDSGPTPSLVDLAREADLLVSECAFPDGEGVPVHLTPSELLRCCREAAPRRVVATHLYPVWDERGVDALWLDALRSANMEIDLVPGRDGLEILL